MDWSMIISAVAAISGMVLGWIGRSRTIREDAAEDGELRANVNYIRKGVEELKLEIKARGQQYEMLAERVTRVEESAKQAHKRLDSLENIVKGKES